MMIIEFSCMILIHSSTNSFRMNCHISQLSNVTNAYFSMHCPVAMNNYSMHYCNRQIIQLMTIVCCAHNFYIVTCIFCTILRNQAFFFFSLNCFHYKQKSYFGYRLGLTDLFCNLTSCWHKNRQFG